MAQPLPKPLRALAISASLLALSACATANVGPPQAASVDAAVSGSSSPYGLFLAGQDALNAGDASTATLFFDKAAQSDPTAGFLKRRLFMAALMAGDVGRAAALAPALEGPGEGDRAMAVLAQGVEDLAQGHGKDAYAVLSTAGGVTGGGAIALLKPWAAAAAGRRNEAIAMPALNDRLLKLVAGIDQGLLLEREHRYGEAETTFRALLGERAAQALVAESYGAFLERRGRRADAVAVYDQVLSGGVQDPDIKAARARAAAHGPAPPPPTVRQGAAQALLVPAAAVLADKQEDLGLLYLRLALRLDPKDAQAWLLVGDVLNDTGNIKGARAAFAQVDARSPEYADARSRLAWSYQPEDKDEALKIARDTIAQLPHSDAAKLTLADLLRADDRFDEAAQIMNPIIASKDGHAEWRLYYMRGVALERAGHWPDAERDLEKALQIQPDQPEVLNYLGYSWINRGEHVKKGMDMIQKALDADPEEGAYVDSLGWAYFRLGDYKNAVQTLERAVTLDAGDAEINDHLGDAYWRDGRRDEARFQWRAVLTMKPNPGLKAQVDAKLDSPLGLDAVNKTPPVAHP